MIGSPSASPAPPTKPPNRTRNSAAPFAAVPSRINLFRLGRVGGVVLRRLMLGRWAAYVTLEDLGNIGEFISSIAVFVSLLYIALQIRQNTKSVRMSTYQAVLDSSHQVNKLFTDPQLERIYRLGRKDLSQLGEDELAQFKALVGTLTGFHEALFLQRQQGAIDDDYFANRFNSFRYIISQPGVRAIWEERGRHYYAPSFVKRVDELLDQPPRDESAAQQPAEPDAK